MIYTKKEENEAFADNDIRTYENEKEASLEPTTENVFRRHIAVDPRKKLLAKHRLWMDNLQHEYPMPYHKFRIGVYIRYYNQTKHENYLDKHIQQFTEDISLCKNWTLVDFYIDKGMSAPRMENAKEWCRLLADCFSGKINLIVTQKVSNVSNDPEELAFIAKTLVAQKEPVGIYFISEDIYTLGSYYRHDLFDRELLPQGHIALPDDDCDMPMICEFDKGLAEITNNKGGLV
ncbi:MAG: recombinase family protein [Firmicutes bacterium]|nr:recombinase family protein [Bacillota bacterium]